MECSCVYVDIDCLSCGDFQKRKIVKAKKTHVCCECHQTILPNEKYEYVCGAWDGNFDQYKTCLNCVSIKKEFFCNGYAFENVLDDLRNHINNAHGDISETCISNLTPIAKDYVCELIEETWEE